MNTKRLAKKVADATTEVLGRKVYAVELTSPTNRYRENVVARTIYRKILRDYGFTLHQIGKLTGCDHSTVVHSLKLYDESSGLYKRQYKTIINCLSESVRENLSYEEYENAISKWADETIDFVKEIPIKEMQGWVRAKIINEIEKCKNI